MSRFYFMKEDKLKWLYQYSGTLCCSSPINEIEFAFEIFKLIIHITS